MNALPLLPLSLRPETAWVEARARVEGYLRAHRMTDERQIARLAADIVQIALATHRPGTAPLTAVMDTMDACLTSWFARQTDADGPEPAHRLVRGRLALKLGEVPARWPSHFLREKATPPDLMNAMRHSHLGAAPAIQLGHMAPRGDEGTVPRQPNGRPAYRWAILRALTGMVMVLTLIGAAVAASLQT